MINGYCEEKYTPVKKIFESYFLKQEEIGASFAIYKEGKPLIDLWGGFKNKENQKWEEDTIVNVISTTKGIYEIIVSILVDRNILDLEKPVSYYWEAFKQSNKKEILDNWFLGVPIKKSNPNFFDSNSETNSPKLFLVIFFITSPIKNP